MKGFVITSVFRVAGKYWKGGVAILLAGLVAGAMWHYNSIISERDDLRITSSSQQERIERFVTNEERFHHAISAQNKAIQDMVDVTSELEREAKRSEERRQQMQEELQKTIRDLYREPIGDTCDDAMDFLLDQAIRNKDND